MTTKIFQIGFNKCATKSLYNLFKKNNIKSIHWDKGYLASNIYNNYKCNNPLISSKYNDIILFTDMENISDLKYGPIYIHRLFKELDKQYPNSKFILNTRYKNDWIRSRIKHGDYLFQISRRLRIHYNHVIKLWKDEWDIHHTNVKKYFEHRPNDLLIYHINKDKPEKIKDFFKDIYQLDITHWEHYGKSK